MFAAESFEIARSVVSRHKRSAALCFFEENVSTGTPCQTRNTKGKTEMKALLEKEATLGVALTSDAWTSVANQSSVTHTVHFIDSDWKLAFAPVPLQSATETCTISNIKAKSVQPCGLQIRHSGHGENTRQLDYSLDKKLGYSIRKKLHSFQPYF